MRINGRNLPRRGDYAVAAFRDDLARTRSTWWTTLLAPGSADRGRAEAAVRSLYQAARKDSPRIVWCDSPLELVRASTSARGADVAGDVTYRSLRRELDALAGRQTTQFRLRSHLLAELQDEQARGALETVWEAVFDVLKVADRDKWEAAHGSVWEYVDYGDVEIGETTQPVFAGSLALAQFLSDHLAFAHTRRAARDLVVSCGGFVLRENLALLSERPLNLDRDDEGRLHNATGPAASWPGGFAIHAWRGIRVAPEIIERPEALEPSRVIEEPNLELRRVMIERIGYERLVSRLRLRPVAKDKSGRLWRVAQPPDEDLVLVEVENATREPDGSRKRYFLRVPPGMRTAREAVAWTFDTTPNGYDPAIET